MSELVWESCSDHGIMGLAFPTVNPGPLGSPTMQGLSCKWFSLAPGGDLVVSTRQGGQEKGEEEGEEEA